MNFMWNRKNRLRDNQKDHARPVVQHSKRSPSHPMGLVALPEEEGFGVSAVPLEINGFPFVNM